uniref:Uncharacterized protein n=1 Tax=Rhizophora mucronata TaxID=61149 RepID=A0A2P2J2D2_RHIMU
MSILSRVLFRHEPQERVANFIDTY